MKQAMDALPYEYHALRNKFRCDHRAFFKYVDDPAETISRSILPQVIMLDLDQCQPKNILDISAGAGFFGFVAQLYGHRVYVTDVVSPEFQLFVEFRQLFGLDGYFRELAYRHVKGCSHSAFAPIPDFGNGVVFDLICATSVPPMCYWRKEEWSEFLNDCISRCRGKVYIKMNRWKVPCSTMGAEALRRFDRYYDITEQDDCFIINMGEEHAEAHEGTGD